MVASSAPAKSPAACSKFVIYAIEWSVTKQSTYTILALCYAAKFCISRIRLMHWELLLFVFMRSKIARTFGTEFYPYNIMDVFVRANSV